MKKQSTQNFGAKIKYLLEQFKQQGDPVICFKEIATDYNTGNTKTSIFFQHLGTGEEHETDTEAKAVDILTDALAKVMVKQGVN